MSGGIPYNEITSAINQTEDTASTAGTPYSSYKEHERNTVLDASTGINMLTTEDIKHRIKRYEMQFHMSSEEFLEQWKAGAMPDTFETNDWAILLDFV